MRPLFCAVWDGKLGMGPGGSLGMRLPICAQCFTALWSLKYGEMRALITNQSLVASFPDSHMGAWEWDSWLTQPHSQAGYTHTWEPGNEVTLMVELSPCMLLSLSPPHPPTVLHILGGLWLSVSVSGPVCPPLTAGLPIQHQRQQYVWYVYQLMTLG